MPCCLQIYMGVEYDTSKAYRYSIAAFKQTIARVLARCNAKASTAVRGELPGVGARWGGERRPPLPGAPLPGAPMRVCRFAGRPCLAVRHSAAARPLWQDN